MTVIKAHCPTCGPVSLQAEQVTVVWYPRRTALNYYKFICPLCADAVSYEEGIAILMKLRHADCNIENIHLPAEAMEERPNWGPLTQDAILDFMNDLQGEDDLASLA